MATTTALYATGTPTQVAGTWTNPTNATGAPNATGTTAPTNCATWVNAARSTTATLELAGYNFQSQIVNGYTISAVTGTVTHAETSTTVLSALTAQLYSGATALGAAVAVTRSTTLTVGTITFPTMPTWAQLADLRVRLTATRSNSTTSTTEYIDAVALQITYTPPPAVSTLTDDFTTSTNWTLLTGGTVTDGQLVLPTTTGFAGAASVNQYSLVGSSVSVQLVQTGGTSVSQTHFYLDGGSGYDIRFQVIGSTLYASYKVGGVESYPASVAYNPAVHRFLRLREVSGDVYWDTSADGTTWTNLNITNWSVAGMKVDVVRPTFYSGYDGTGAAPADSVFDNYNLVPRPKVETFTDAFTTADTGKWTFAANASVTGGQLQLTSSATYRGVDSVATYDLTGSSLTVEVPQVAGGGTTLDTEMNMQVGTAAAQVDNKLTMLHENGTLYFRVRIAAVNNDTTLAYSATAHRWWRIAESGGVVTFSTAPDGQTWTVRRSWTNTGIAITAMTVRLQTGHWSTEATPGSALYDNVNIQPSVTTPTVGAGPPTTAHQNAAFWRLATESGASISARAWTITAGPAGVGSTIGTAAALVWTPTVTGTYTLQYAATNAGGTGTDTVTVTVVAAPAPLATWQVALTAKTAQAVLLGDSLTEGQAATTMAARWVNLIQPTIRTSASITGGGVGYLPGWTATWVGWTPYTSQTGVNTKLSSDLSLGLRTDGMSAAATTTFTVTGTSADLHWVAGYGSFTWAVDGGSATTVSTAGTTGTPSRTRITLGSATSHTLTITATTAVHFSGVMVYNGDETSGARFYEAGHSAFNADAFLGGAALWSLINADLYVIELGVNDFLHVTATSTQVRDYLRRMVDEVRSAASGKDPSIAVLIPGAWPQGLQDAGQTELWSAYQAAIASLGTDEPSIAVITMPDLTTGQLDSDLLHPINAGQTAIASTVATALSLGGTLNATGTAALSGSGSLTTSGTPRPVSTAALSGTGTLTPGTGTPRPAAAATLSGTGTLAAGTGTPRPAAAAALSGSGSLAAAGAPRPATSAALSGSGTLTTSGTAVAGQATQLSGTGTLVAGGAPVYAGAAQLSGTGSLASTGLPTTAATAVLSGSGSLSASGAVAVAPSATLSGSGSLVAGGAPAATGTASLSGTGSLTVTPAGVTTGQAAALSGTGSLAATGTAAVTAAVVLTGSGSLVVPGGTPATAGTAVLGGTGTLAPASAVSTAGTAALSGTGTLVPAAGTAAVAAAAALSGTGSLLAAGTPGTTQTVSLSGTGTLATSGLATGEGTGAVSLSGTGTLAAAGVPALQRTAVLSGTGTLVAGGSGSQAGGAAAVLSGTGSLAATGGIRTQGAVSLSGSGTLSAQGAPAVQRAATLAGTGTLTTGGIARIGAAGTFSGTGTLNAAGTGKSAGGGSATLGGSGTLSTTALPGMGRPAALSGLGTLVPVGAVRLTRLANLSGSGQLVALGLVTEEEPEPGGPELTWVRVGAARERWQVRAGPLRTAVRVGPALPMPLLVRPMRR